MNNNITLWELGMGCIVCIGSIVGKVWMYYKVDLNENETNNK
jgi:hypothetical protein